MKPCVPTPVHAATTCAYMLAHLQSMPSLYILLPYLSFTTIHSLCLTHLPCAPAPVHLQELEAAGPSNITAVVQSIVGRQRQRTHHDAPRHAAGEAAGARSAHGQAAAHGQTTASKVGGWVGLGIWGV